MNDGWIEWNGGECPIKSDKTLVEVRYSDGDIAGPDSKINWMWTWICGGRGGDIIAYRIIENHEPAEIAQIDMTQNRVPWGLLTDEERGAIEGHKGVIMWYDPTQEKWKEVDIFMSIVNRVYRTVASPVITEATFERHIGEHLCKITLTYHDGKPISGTVKI